MTQPPQKATAVLEPIEDWIAGAPPTDTTLLDRPRLLSRLTDGVGGLLTCISGPAGSGKTSLAEAWFASPGRPDWVVGTGWLTIDPDAERAGRFWRQCAAVLGAAGVRTDDLTVLPDARLPAALAARIVARAEPVVLVLDDFHLLHGRALIGGLDLLVRRAAPYLRLVLLTRAEPALSTARYRLTGGYTDIRGDELAFTAEEAGRLLATEFVPASAAALTALMARTEGWITGLRLFVTSLPVAADAAEVERRAAAFGAEDRWVANYLEREVLDSLPAGSRTFLERTSIASRLPVELATELTGRADAERLLGTLVAHNAFIEACGPDGYRFHPLFHDLLRARLRRNQPAELAELHRVAAGWRARHGSMREALNHAAESGDWRFLARLIVEEQLFVSVLAGGPIAGLVRAARGVPEPEMWRNPDAAVVGALLSLQGKDDLRVQALLARLRVMIRTWPRPNARLAAATIQLRLAMRRADEADEADRLADEALAALADATIGNTGVRFELRCLIAAERGLALIALDRLDEARTTLAEALEPALGAGSEQLHGSPLPHGSQLLHGCQLLRSVEAFALAMHGDLGSAATGAREVLEQLPGRGRTSRAATYCHLALAWVHAERAEPAPARTELAAVSDRWLRQDVLGRTVATLLGTRVRGLSVPRARALAGPAEAGGPAAPLLLAMRAAVLVARGEAAPAEQLLLEAGGTSPAERIQLARTMLALERPTDALRQVSEIPEQAGLASLCSLVDAHLTLAKAADETGDVALAGRSLGTALRLARRERIRRPFLDERRWLRRSIGYLIDNPERYGWLGPTVLGPRAGAPGPETAPLTQPLSEREREVVKKLAEMLSTEEIAVDLFLSVNTVKTHLRSIYRKLAATRRGEAVRRARELGIL